MKQYQSGLNVEKVLVPTKAFLSSESKPCIYLYINNL